MARTDCVLDGRSLTIENVVSIARNPTSRVSIDPSARSALSQSRQLVERAIQSGQTIYGINTGFGKLANVRVPADQIDQLQTNLIRSHASGVGAPLPAPVVRAVMLLRANVLLRPTSGVRPELVDALVDLLNAGVVPMVPEQGSVGASGDLAPLSHIGLALMGEGHVLSDGGAPAPADAALKGARLSPYRFAPKEGIAFINGTQAQTALLAMMVHDARVLWRTAVGAAAMSLEALRGTPAPLDPRIHQSRPHPGQSRAAALMRELLEKSEIRESHRENDPRVQDAYSLRCAPQVLGAVADAIAFAEQTAIVELNASTAFLTSDPGLCSGFMMVQIAAASLVAESRALAMPASIGSIPTDANQEDFVPMGMAAAYKAGRILVNAQRVVAAELLCAGQGLEFLKPLKPGRGVAQLYQQLRTLDPPVPPLTADRPPGPDLERVTQAIREGVFDPRPGT
jgi:histidine ammonia-lyase